MLSTVVGFFNNVVLYPVKKANLTFRYKLEAFEKYLREKTKHIPNENLQVPPVMIAGPTLEALRYTYDEAELREMYENLLSHVLSVFSLICLVGTADSNRTQTSCAHAALLSSRTAMPDSCMKHSIYFVGRGESNPG